MVDLSLVVEVALDDLPGLPEDLEALLLVGREHAVFGGAGRGRLEDVQERERPLGRLGAAEQVAADERHAEGEHRHEGGDDDVGQAWKGSLRLHGGLDPEAFPGWDSTVPFSGAYAF